MSRKLDLTKMRFGRLIAVAQATNIGRYTRWVCKCDCGEKVTAYTNSLRQGGTTSCGCGKLDRIKQLNKYQDPKKEFWKLVKRGKHSECWEWRRGVNSSGYGAFMGRGAHVQAYQFFHEMAVGKDVCVLHSCDNRKCCNPKHLFLGDHKINAIDAWNKGRNFYQKHPDRRPRGESHKNSKLTAKIVREIRKKYATGRYRQIDLANRYGSTQAGISQIIRNVSWKI